MDITDKVIEEVEDGELIDIDTACANLANAVIEQAVKDVLKNPSKYYHGVMRFFKSGFYDALTNIDRSVFINYINKELAKRNIIMS